MGVERWFDPRQGQVVPLLQPQRLALGPTQPPTQSLPEAHYLEVQRPGREADHSPHLLLE
jgi:hypothetical protein